MRLGVAINKRFVALTPRDCDGVGPDVATQDMHVPWIYGHKSGATTICAPPVAGVAFIHLALFMTVSAKTNLSMGLFYLPGHTRVFSISCNELRGELSKRRCIIRIRISTTHPESCCNLDTTSRTTETPADALEEITAPPPRRTAIGEAEGVFV